VLDAGQREAAAVLLVITTSVTNSLLHQIEVTRQASRAGKQYIFRAVKSGLISLLYRSESSYDRIIRAIEAAAANRTELPHSILRHLTDQVRAAQDPADPNGPSTTGLGSREREVLRLLAEGYATREIGAKPNYSERMVKNIVHGIVVRLNLRNRTHAVAYALRTGIMS
jgi:DNA-binding NarL/FixJ family response regulator